MLVSSNRSWRKSESVCFATEPMWNYTSNWTGPHFATCGTNEQIRKIAADFIYSIWHCQFPCQLEVVSNTVNLLFFPGVTGPAYMYSKTPRPHTTLPRKVLYWVHGDKGQSQFTSSEVCIKFCRHLARKGFHRESRRQHLGFTCALEKKLGQASYWVGFLRQKICCVHFRKRKNGLLSYLGGMSPSIEGVEGKGYKIMFVCDLLFGKQSDTEAGPKDHQKSNFDRISKQNAFGCFPEYNSLCWPFCSKCFKIRAEGVDSWCGQRWRKKSEQWEALSCLVIFVSVVLKCHFLLSVTEV